MESPLFAEDEFCAEQVVEQPNSVDLFSFSEVFRGVFSLAREKCAQWVAVWWIETESELFVVCQVFSAALVVVPVQR